MRRVLLNPGPANTSDAVKRALVIPDVCPRDRDACASLQSVCEELAGLLAADGTFRAIPFVGSGTAALEAALGSLAPPDRITVVLDNGDYGERLAEISAALEIPSRVIRTGWGASFRLRRLEAVLDELGPRAGALACVHHETSTGMLNPVEEIGPLARSRGLTVIVDAMSSFPCVPLAPEWADAVVLSSAKCLQAVAGLAFVLTRSTLLEQGPIGRPRGYYLDLFAQDSHLQATGEMRFTFPPQLVSALQRALRELREETAVGRRARYDTSFEVLAAGLRDLGLELLLPAAEQSRILVAVRAPTEAWFDYRRLHDLLDERGFTIYPGKAGTVECFRLAVLGDIDAADLRAFLAALEDCLSRMNTSEVTPCAT
ncbi:MAG: aminotransferase class V-fold PLP-dependent enzyme [Acidobacteriota bacterium]